MLISDYKESIHTVHLTCMYVWHNQLFTRGFDFWLHACIMHASCRPQKGTVFVTLHVTMLISPKTLYCNCSLFANSDTCNYIFLFIIIWLSPTSAPGFIVEGHIYTLYSLYVRAISPSCLNIWEMARTICEGPLPAPKIHQVEWVYYWPTYMPAL